MTKCSFAISICSPSLPRPPLSMGSKCLPQFSIPNFSMFQGIWLKSFYIFIRTHSLMCKHEVKSCPRCQSGFECRVGDIINCQCYGIQLSAEEETFIQSNYQDCLCRNCLLQLKSRYLAFVEKKVLYNQRWVSWMLNFKFWIDFERRWRRLSTCLLPKTISFECWLSPAPTPQRTVGVLVIFGRGDLNNELPLILYCNLRYLLGSNL